MYNKKNNFELFESNVQSVREDWIDYNGHMNVAYYTLAFDKALDDFLEKNLEIGPTYVKREKKGPYSLQANYHYLDELRITDEFFTKIYLINSDNKKIHLVLEMINFKDINIKYVGRSASSTTATGNANKHLAQQKEILEKILKQ